MTEPLTAQHDRPRSFEHPGIAPLDLLVVVDSTKASHKVLQYLASSFRGFDGVQFHLIWLEPTVPARMLETGGADTPEREERVEANFRKDQARWIAAEDQVSDAIIRDAESYFRGQGIPPEAVSICPNSPLDNRSTVERLLLAADDQNCRTIVIGHSAHAWYQDLSGSHLAEQLVREARGLAIWVVD